ncbi:hypothetical protein A6V39_02285 [Candidatus Mycoplasma haematobovis]|uniref:Uncharacterized protein n=1 Tax=Candidatus Mycoplasma haematobovis TaxID=432608 RepID=A0A1A9QEY3_9MOLU|nr:hypothetical protein [Candidatus Mycoplasma haematobovis]OAL10250.1 hypothetical protein A6V39_02285 [Candidatus Mycoplasma haematobovis]
MADNQEEEFLDKDEILAEDEEEEEIVEEPEEEKQEEEELKKEEEFVCVYDPSSKAYKCCHEALKRQTSLIFLWVLFLLVFLGGIATLFATKALDFDSKKRPTITAIPFASVAAIAIVAKIVALKMQNGFFLSEKHNYTIALPEKPNKLIQEFYVLQQCRKCSQYWIFIILTVLSIITGIYCVIVSAILKACGQTGHSGLFEMSSNLGFGQDTVAAVTTLSWMTLPIWALCYGVASLRTDKIIKSLERTYPKAEIIDCSLCNHKLEASNKRKKLIAFAIVCSLGFFIYFFFKRFTCTIFERSFQV